MAIEAGLEVYDSDYESADQQQNRPRSRSLSSVGSRSSGRSASTAATDYSDDEDVMMGPENWRKTYGFQEPADLDTLGGHQGSFMTNEDGSLACKRAGKGEMEFYGRVAAGDPPFKHLGSVIPVYHGTVEHPSTKDSSSLSPTKKLGTVSDVELGIKPLARGNTVDEHEQSIILSNLLYGFKPETVTCADFKIGTSMHMSNADEQKVSEMEKQVDNTSSKHYGLRLVWGQTALESEDGAWSHVRSGKSYGRNIRKSPDDVEPWKDTLDDAIARFFPMPGETIVSREDKDMKREAELREAGTQVVHRDDPSTEASSRLAMRNGTWPKREDAVTVESQLQSLKKRKAAIEDMQDLIEDTKTQLSEISEAIRKTSCWKFTGSSVFLVHGVPEQWATGDDDLEGEMHLDWGVDSMGLPWDERDEWAVDRVAPEWNKPVLSPQGTRKGRTSYNGSLTGPGTSGSLAESSTVLSRPRRQVHVALIDHERGEWAVGPDEGALMGVSNFQKGLDSRLNTLASEQAKCDTELNSLASRTTMRNTATGTMMPRLRHTRRSTASGIPTSMSRMSRIPFSPLPTIPSATGSGTSFGLSRQSLHSESLISPPPTLTASRGRNQGAGRGSWSIPRDEERSTIGHLRKSSSFVNASSLLGSALNNRMI